jgi:hypothetical protein
MPMAREPPGVRPPPIANGAVARRVSKRPRPGTRSSAGSRTGITSATFGTCRGKGGLSHKEHKEHKDHRISLCPLCPLWLMPVECEDTNMQKRENRRRMSKNGLAAKLGTRHRRQRISPTVGKLVLMRLRLAAAGFMAASVIAAPCLAWHDVGHMLTTLVAYKLLSPGDSPSRPIRRPVAILKQHPHFQEDFARSMSLSDTMGQTEI